MMDRSVYDIEKSVIGSILLNGKAIEHTQGIGSDDFALERHSVIFRAIEELHAHNEPYDLLSVTEHLRRSGHLPKVGGAAYLTSLIDIIPDLVNLPHYSKTIRRRAIERKVAEQCQKYLESYKAGDVQDGVDQHCAAVNCLIDNGATGSWVSLLDSALEVHSQAVEASEHGDQRTLSTGIGTLDEALNGGLSPGDLVFIGARPAMGKTALALTIATASRKRVGFFSLEMPRQQLASRYIAGVSNVSTGQLRSGKLNDEQWSEMTSAVGRAERVPVWIDDSPGLSLREIKSRATALQIKHGVDLIVLDYLQLATAGITNNRVQDVSAVSRGLKEMAKQLGVPVIALAQLNRKLEERVDKRPILSDLRECVTGDTLVVLSDGRRVPVRELVGQTPFALSVTPDGRLEPAATDKIWSVGKKEILHVKLASGRSLRCSGKHRLRALWDWKEAGSLQPGDRIALARYLPEPIQPISWPEHHIILLAHLVGDGSYVKKQPLRYTTASEENSRAVTESAEAFGAIVNRHKGRGNWHQLVISGNGNRWHPKGVGKWLKDLAIFGQRSHEKHLPSSVFQLPNEQVALFLRHLWATDGSISVDKRGGVNISFCTTSEKLIRDVAALLLRFGIVARIKHITTAESPKGWFTATVSGAEYQRIFLSEIGAFGPRQEPAKRAAAMLEKIVANTNVDTLPKEVREQIRAAMRSRNMSNRDISSERGRFFCATNNLTKAPSRNFVAEISAIIGDEALLNLAKNDLFWDTVVSVESSGEEEVFDLTVPGNACWLADGIVSHNSGQVEQDADIIIFLYREWVYNKNYNEPGHTEAIIAKYRNGQTCTVNLEFIPEKTLFREW